MDINRIVNNIKQFDFSRIDIDCFLDERDSDVFGNEWNEIYRQINQDLIPADIRQLSDNLRREVFLELDKKLGASDMSEYISDDIELLIFSDYLNIYSEWLSKFIEIYEEGHLPTGKII